MKKIIILYIFIALIFFSSCRVLILALAYGGAGYKQTTCGHHACEPFDGNTSNVVYLRDFYMKVRKNKPSEEQVVLTNNVHNNKNNVYYFYYYNCRGLFPAKIDLIDTKTDSIITTLSFSKSNEGNVKFTVPRNTTYKIKATSSENITLYFRLGIESYK